ncbi:MAG: hypothetical protein Q7S80_03180 [bacterium]|nr:hypothetical protein [bacterium]
MPVIVESNSVAIPPQFDLVDYAAMTVDFGTRLDGVFARCALHNPPSQLTDCIRERKWMPRHHGLVTIIPSIAIPKDPIRTEDAVRILKRFKMRRAEPYVTLNFVDTNKSTPDHFVALDATTKWNNICWALNFTGFTAEGKRRVIFTRKDGTRWGKQEALLVYRIAS